MKAYLEALALSIIAIFAPIKAIMITAMALVFVDLVLGLMAARKRKEPITSAGFRRTITKALVYEAGLMIGFVTEIYLLNGLIPVSKLIGAMIGVVECKSCLENLNELNGAPVFATIINKLGSSNDQESSK